MNYLITGGLGFIGINFILYMIDKDKSSKYIILDKINYASNIEFIDLFKENKQIHFIKGDIRDKKILNKIFSKYKIDYVVNFAAETSVDKSFLCPDDFVDNNYNGLINLVNISFKYDIKRFHHISTDEVYGESFNKIFKEDDKLNPSNPYSYSKMLCDLYLLKLIKDKKYNITISRCSNNYGKYQYHDKLIPLIVKNIVENNNINLYGNGLNKRNWLYVIDHVKAIDLIINHGNSGEIYNISGNIELTNLALTKYIINYFNYDINKIRFVNNRKYHDYNYLISQDKIEKELNYKNKTNFYDTLIDTIKYYEKYFINK